MADTSELAELKPLVNQLQDVINHLKVAIEDYRDPAGQTGLYGRKKIMELAGQIITTVKHPAEKPHEYPVNMAELGALRLLMHMKAFDYIPESGVISYDEIGKKVNAEAALIKRLCRMLVATGVLRQEGEDEVGHTKFSPFFARRNPQGMIAQMIFDEGLVPWTRWPDFFAKYGYKEPLEGNHIPHSFAWGDPSKTFWSTIDQWPQRFSDFNVSMETMDELLPVTGIYDFNWIIDNASEVSDEAPLIVDVGGGKGHSLWKIMKEYPRILGPRLVLQDRKQVIEEVKQINDPRLSEVKKMPHDIFQEQPIKGALVYYIRRVLHDWSDKNDTIILSHLAQAMTPKSRVLITEQILPVQPTTLTAWTDLEMLNIGGKERTKKDWRKLAASAGLEVVKFWESPATEVGVIECKKAE